MTTVHDWKAAVDGVQASVKQKCKYCGLEDVLPLLFPTKGITELQKADNKWRAQYRYAHHHKCAKNPRSKRPAEDDGDSDDKQAATPAAAAAGAATSKRRKRLTTNSAATATAAVPAAAAAAAPAAAAAAAEPLAEDEASALLSSMSQASSQSSTQSDSSDSGEGGGSSGGGGGGGSSGVGSGGGGMSYKAVMIDILQRIPLHPAGFYFQYPDRLVSMGKSVFTRYQQEEKNKFFVGVKDVLTALQVNGSTYYENSMSGFREFMLNIKNIIATLRDINRASASKLGNTVFQFDTWFDEQCKPYITVGTSATASYSKPPEKAPAPSAKSATLRTNSTPAAGAAAAATATASTAVAASTSTTDLLQQLLVESRSLSESRQRHENFLDRMLDIVVQQQATVAPPLLLAPPPAAIIPPPTHALQQLPSSAVDSTAAAASALQPVATQQQRAGASRTVGTPPHRPSAASIFPSPPSLTS